MSEVKAVVERAKLTGHRKVAGEHSLSVGEIVFTILGILLIAFGSKANIPAKYRLPLGLMVIFIGEWVF